MRPILSALALSTVFCLTTSCGEKPAIVQPPAPVLKAKPKIYRAPDLKAENAAKDAALEREIAALEAEAEKIRQDIENEQAAMDREALEQDRIKLEQDRIAWLEAQVAALTKKSGPEKTTRSSNVDPLPPPAPVVRDYRLFYTDLSQHGTWFQSVNYGYVWQPAVATSSSWRPYTAGRWASCEKGWTWLSDEPFGWATYHYGRWARIKECGWIWVPGEVWAPAWVAWRQSDQYIGWCPLPPETLYHGNVTYDSGIDKKCGIRPEAYIFIPIKHFCSPVRDHCELPERSGVICRNTTNITRLSIQNSVADRSGPKYDWIKERLPRPPARYLLTCDSRPDGDHRFRIEQDRLAVFSPVMRAPWNPTLSPPKIAGPLPGSGVPGEGILPPAKLQQQFRDDRKAWLAANAKLMKSEALQAITERQNRLVAREAANTAAGTPVASPGTRPRTENPAGPGPAVHLPRSKPTPALAARQEQQDAILNQLQERQAALAKLRENAVRIRENPVATEAGPRVAARSTTKTPEERRETPVKPSRQNPVPDGTGPELTAAVATPAAVPTADGINPIEPAAASRAPGAGPVVEPPGSRPATGESRTPQGALPDQPESVATVEPAGTPAPAEVFASRNARRPDQNTALAERRAEVERLRQELAQRQRATADARSMPMPLPVAVAQPEPVVMNPDTPALAPAMVTGGAPQENVPAAAEDPSAALAARRQQVETLKQELAERQMARQQPRGAASPEQPQAEPPATPRAEMLPARDEAHQQRLIETSRREMPRVDPGPAIAAENTPNAQGDIAPQLPERAAALQEEENRKAEARQRPAEARQLQAEAQQSRMEAAAARQQQLENEQRARQAEDHLAQQQQEQEEANRQQQLQQQQMQQQQQAAAEARQIQLEAQRAQLQEAARQQEERLAGEQQRQLQEQQAQQQQEAARAQQQRMAEEQRAQLEEAARIQQQREAEERQRQAEEQRAQMEEAARQQQQREAEERQRQAEEQRARQEEAARQQQQQREAEERQRQAEEQRARQEEAARQQQQQREAEERQAEEQRARQEEAARQQQQREAEERQRQAEEQRARQEEAARQQQQREAEERARQEEAARNGNK